MITTSMLPSSIWSRLSPGLQVTVMGGGVYSAVSASSNKVPLLCYQRRGEPVR